MRSDYRRATETLQRTFRSVKRFKGKTTNNVAFAARLFDFAAVLFENPLVKYALQELESQQYDQGQAFENWISSVEKRLRQRFVAVIAAVKRVHEYELSDDRVAASVGAARDWLMTNQDKLLACATVQLQRPSKGLFGLPALSEIEEQLTEYSSLIIEVEKNLLGPLTGIAEKPNLPLLAEACKKLHRACNASQEWQEIARFLSAVHFDGLSRLQRFYETARSVLAGKQKVPLSLHNNSAVHLFDFEATEAAVDKLLGYLNAGAQRLYILDRMKVFFEHFGYEELRVKIENKGNRKIEDVIQDEMEKFLFLEGVFPLVHSEAARGSLDALIERYGAAEHPILIELKQCIDIRRPKSISAPSVRRKIDEGRRQAAIYSEHVRSNTKWRMVEPVVVVFYNSPQPLVFGEDDLWLIYVGKGNPSGSQSA